MTWEYIAGFFEGEGTITTWRTRSNHTFVRICIPQKVHPEIVHEIQAFIGYGYIHVDKRGTSRLSINRKSHVENFLRGIYPHMVSTRKRRVAKLAWKILQLQRNNTDNVGLPYEVSNHDERRRLASEIRRIQGRKKNEHYVQPISH